MMRIFSMQMRSVCRRNDTYQVSVLVDADLEGVQPLLEAQVVALYQIQVLAEDPPAVRLLGRVLVLLVVLGLEGDPLLLDLALRQAEGGDRHQHGGEDDDDPHGTLGELTEN